MNRIFEQDGLALHIMKVQEKLRDFKQSEGPKPTDPDALFDWVNNRQKSVWALRTEGLHMKVESGYTGEKDELIEKGDHNEFLQEGGLLNPAMAERKR